MRTGFVFPSRIGNCRRTLSVATSITVTFPPASALTQTCRPSGVNATVRGLSPTWIVRRTAPVFASSTETLLLVSVLDAKTGAVLRTIHVGDNPRTVAFTPDGRHVWVSAEAGGNVTVIDVATDSVLRQFPIRDGKTKPVRIAFSPDARLAYLTEGAAATVSVIDVATSRVLD